MDDGQGLAVMPEQVLPPPEGALAPKLPADGPQASAPGD